MTETQSLLQVRDLSVVYETDTGAIPAVTGLDLDVLRGETLGIIGESGCGKSTMAYAVLRLLQSPGRINSGTVVLDGEELAAIPEARLRSRRWSRISLIPQGAMNSLNPTMSVKAMFRATFRAHGREGRGDAACIALLEKVGLAPHVANLFPHELSGGMKQRVCIALSIALSPDLVIADEPTSALDVIVQRTVCQTLLRIRSEMGMSMIVIGHDIGLMSQLADRIGVMYAGQLVEIAPTSQMLDRPQHPYSRMLLNSATSLGRPRAQSGQGAADAGGIMHDPRKPPSGCIFRLRCPKAQALCAELAPAWQAYGPQSGASCHFSETAGDPP